MKNLGALVSIGGDKLKTLEQIYRDSGTINYIHKVVDEVSGYIENTEKLEENIFSQLVKYFEHEVHRSWKRIKYLIDREVKKARERFGMNLKLFSELSTKNEEGSELTFDPEDELALISRKVEAKEDIKKVISLATDDRKKIALNGLMDGDTVTKVSETLQRLYGGNSETHRKFITRFKKDCRNAVNVAN